MSEQENTGSRLVKISENIVLTGMIVINLIVALLDFLGALDEYEWLAARVPILILLSTAAIIGYLLLERRNQLQAIQNDTKQGLDSLTTALTQSSSTIIQSLDGVESRPFDRGDELLKYVNKRLLQARRQVDDLSWSSEVGLGRAIEQTKQVSEEYARRLAKVSQNIPYREVFIFDMPRRVEKLQQVLAENAPGYSCAYYEPSNIPRLQFMIIDQEEVILLSDEFPQKLAIRHKALAKLFTEYYEAIWAGATKIKEGPIIHPDVVNEILSRYGQEFPTI